MTKKISFLSALFFLLWGGSFLSPALAVNEICASETPCCSAPQAVEDGGGCPVGQTWVGGILDGSCQTPTVCAVGEQFLCATNSCATLGNTCSTSDVDTGVGAACCALGEVAVSDGAGGWVCGAGGGVSPWSSDADGPYVWNAQVGIGQNAAGGTYSLHVRADGNNAATTGAISAYSSLVNGVGIDTNSTGIGINAFGDQIGGVFWATSDIALQAVSGDAIRAISDATEGVGTVVGFFRGLGGGTNQVQIGSSSNHDVALLRNGTTFVTLFDNGVRRYVNFQQGTDANPTIADSGSVIVGNPAAAHLVLDSNEIMVKANGNTSAPLYVNDGGNTILSSNGGNVTVTPTVASATNLCITAGNLIATCSSSIRYKENVRPLSALLHQKALEVIKKLRPVTFDWIEGDKEDIGLIAEEVQNVFPQAVTYKDGKIQGVKYDQLSALLIQGMQEQQEMIEDQQKEIDELKNLVCLDHADSDYCKQQL